MAWPTTGDVDTTDFDDATDDPNAARLHLVSAIDQITEMKNARSAADGVASLNSLGLVPVGELPPATKASQGAIELAIQSEVNAGLSSTLAISPFTLDNWPGSNAITTIGTIGTGAWNGTVINEPYGGTGQAGGYTNGELLIGNTTGNVLVAAAPTAGKAMQITLGAGSLTFAVASSTTSQVGVVEMATQTETNNGSGNRVVTASTLHNRTASETRAGIVERATQQEVSVGTDTVRYVSPATLAGKLQGFEATQAEMESATVSTKYVSPRRVHHHRGVSKAWVRFNGTGTPGIKYDYGVDSIDDLGVGNYDIHLTGKLSNAHNMAAVGTCTITSAVSNNFTTTWGHGCKTTRQTASTVRVLTYNGADVPSSQGGLADHSNCNVIIMGDF